MKTYNVYEVPTGARVTIEGVILDNGQWFEFVSAVATSTYNEIGRRLFIAGLNTLWLGNYEEVVTVLERDRYVSSN